MKRRRGFTLVELLVAISVLAIVAVLGWRGLDSIIRARIALTDDLQQTRGLQLAFAQMQADSSHIVPAKVILPRPQLVAQPGRLTLIRTVFAENQPSRLQVVAYRLRDGVLTRRESVGTRDLRELDRIWAAVLGDTDSAGPVVLRSGLAGMTIRVWDSQNAGWKAAEETLHDPNRPANPRQWSGLEVTLQENNAGSSLVKIFLLGAM